MSPMQSNKRLPTLPRFGSVSNIQSHGECSTHISQKGVILLLHKKHYPFPVCNPTSAIAQQRQLTVLLAQTWKCDELVAFLPARGTESRFCRPPFCRVKSATAGGPPQGRGPARGGAGGTETAAQGGARGHEEKKLRFQDARSSGWTGGHLGDVMHSPTFDRFELLFVRIVLQ